MAGDKERLAGPDRILDGVRLGIFDWSGVISDDRRPVYEANMRMFDSYGIARVTIDDFFSNARQSAREYFAATGISVSSEEVFQQYKKNYAAVVEEGILPSVYSDAPDVLKDLRNRGVSLALISSHPESFLVDEAKKYGVFDLFGIIRGSAGDKALGIVDAAAGFGFLPGETFYIGDTIYDVQSARRAHTRSIAITTGYHSRDRLSGERPDFLIDNLSELLAA